MWDLPGPGIDPMSPALIGGFFIIEPPGKPRVGLRAVKTFSLVGEREETVK